MTMKNNYPQYFKAKIRAEANSTWYNLSHTGKEVLARRYLEDLYERAIRRVLEDLK